MKTKITIFAFLIFSFFCLRIPTALAEGEITTSANFASVLEQKPDTRALALRDYLKSQGSPMADYAGIFVREADHYAIPWDLVVAIDGTESTFGKFEPGPNCHNGWGYGIYGTNVLCFPSYEEAITTISKDIREKYINKWGAQTVAEIGSYYAASTAWPGHTAWFMQQIEEHKVQFDNRYLSISL